MPCVSDCVTDVLRTSACFFCLVGVATVAPCLLSSVVDGTTLFNKVPDAIRDVVTMLLPAEMLDGT